MRLDQASTADRTTLSISREGITWERGVPTERGKWVGDVANVWLQASSTQRLAMTAPDEAAWGRGVADVNVLHQLHDLVV